MPASPFDLAQPQTYLPWRERKLSNYPTSPEPLLVEIADPLALSAGERTALLDRCRQTNMAIYACSPLSIEPKEAVGWLGRQFGLNRLDRNLCADPDGIASLRHITESRPQEYIPYSNRPIRWHSSACDIWSWPRTSSSFSPGLGGVVFFAVMSRQV